ncbi:hypothetical protein T01_7957 [Trichinella spiralis]|uniref:Uncharacterized protein n=1 Tax=Trichinella spiralis TaxID=6334 RepID=A0A0V1AWR5_TRISP|nr:hypothetical protein T01_7957 [Trichinella spiralis]
MHHLDLFIFAPVALQKGERDTQVQFRRRRHTAPLYQRSSSRTLLKGCNPAGSQVAAVFASTFLSSSLTRVERRLMCLPPGSPASNGPVSYVWLLSDIPGVVPLHPVGVYHERAALPLMVPYAVRLRPNYLHYVVRPFPATVELPSSWHRQPHAVVRAEA